MSSSCAQLSKLMQIDKLNELVIMSMDLNNFEKTLKEIDNDALNNCSTSTLNKQYYSYDLFEVILYKKEFNFFQTFITSRLFSKIIKDYIVGRNLPKIRDIIEKTLNKGQKYFDALLGSQSFKNIGCDQLIPLLNEKVSDGGNFLWTLVMRDINESFNYISKIKCSNISDIFFFQNEKENNYGILNYLVAENKIDLFNKFISHDLFRNLEPEDKIRLYAMLDDDDKNLFHLMFDKLYFMNRLVECDYCIEGLENKIGPLLTQYSEDDGISFINNIWRLGTREQREKSLKILTNIKFTDRIKIEIIKNMGDDKEIIISNNLANDTLYFQDVEKKELLLKSEFFLSLPDENQKELIGEQNAQVDEFANQ